MNTLGPSMLLSDNRYCNNARQWHRGNTASIQNTTKVALCSILSCSMQWKESELLCIPDSIKPCSTCDSLPPISCNHLSFKNIKTKNWNWFELMQNGSRRDGGGFVWPIGTNRADYVCGQSGLLTLDRCEYYLLRVACCSIAPPW